jgi:hypothetical protein
MSRLYYTAKTLLPQLWLLGRALLYVVATWADTCSNQAIKDRGQRRCGISNLGKIINFVAATFYGCAYLAGICLVFQYLPIKLEQKVAAPFLGKCFKHSDFSLLAFTSSLFALYSTIPERISSIFSQSLYRESAPVAKLLTNSKMTLSMTEARYQHAKPQ